MDTQATPIRKRIASYGEVMMRLETPLYQMLEQTNQLNFSFVGTGVNLLASLYKLGHQTALVTALPDNQIGRAGAAQLRKLGIGDQFVAHTGGHIGSYLLELGYGPRPSVVTYQDRLGSSFCQSTPHDPVAVSQWADLIHVCGITLSLTEHTRAGALALARTAKAQGKQLCFDFNYRPKLNKNNDWAVLKSEYEQMLTHSDIVFGNHQDLSKLFGIDHVTGTDTLNHLKVLADKLMQTYAIETFCGTVRQQERIVGFIIDSTGLHMTPSADISHKLDRIGSGDAFAATVLHGLSQGWPHQQTLTYATASSVLAHTTLGDVPLFNQDQLRQFIDNPHLDLLR